MLSWLVMHPVEEDYYTTHTQVLFGQIEAHERKEKAINKKRGQEERRKQKVFLPFVRRRTNEFCWLGHFFLRFSFSLSLSLLTLKCNGGKRRKEEKCTSDSGSISSQIVVDCCYIASCLSCLLPCFSYPDSSST